MTELLEKAIAKATQLPEDGQNTIATIILEEIEDEVKWKQAFNSSFDKLEILADEALKEFKAGKTKKLDWDQL
jgi:hypothetical protein